jgi:hypothetical protein
MINEEHIKAWLDYMTTQKILQHFRPIHKVEKDKIQYWGRLKFPILECTYGTYNFPELRIIGIFEFVEKGYFEKWIEIKKNEKVKYDSNCNVLAYLN